MNFFKAFGILVLLNFCASEKLNVEEFFTCPPEGDHYYPHPICTKFIVCSHGFYYEFDCAEGTFWNQEKKICDYDDSGCATQPTEPTTVTTPVETDPPTDSPTTQPTDAPTTVQPTVGPTDGPTTVEPTQGPTDGPTTVQPTVGPTDGPTTVQPTDGPSTVEPTTTTAEPTTTTAESTTTTAEPTTTTAEPTEGSTTAQPTEIPTTTENLFPCPETGYHTLPHHSVCNLYYRCFDGELIGIFSCGVEKWFDSRTESCVNPEASDCPYKE